MISSRVARLLDGPLALRFLLVGLINTAVGYGIMLAGLRAGLGDIGANLLGHVLGLGFSYGMHHRFTYRQSGHGRSPMLYLVSVALAYLVNLGVVLFFTRAMGVIGNPLVHLAAIGAYAASLYCLTTLVAFDRVPVGRDRQREDAAMWPEGLLALVMVAAFVLSPLVGVSPDVNWQLWMARHMNAGVPIYDWIMETNPPLWFWMAQPVALVADAIGQRQDHVYVAWVLVLVGLAFALSAALTRDWPARQRAGLFAGLFGGLVLTSIGDFGQRDHEALIGLVPYAILVARRAEGKAVGWPLALAVGLLATPLVALKHYFALVPILLEMWLSLRRWRVQPLRPETLCLAAGAVVYGGAIFLFARSYLTEIVPMLALAYGEFRGTDLHMVINPLTLVLPMAGFYFWHFRRELPLPTQAMLVVAAGFLLSFYLQRKGWAYHAHPVVGALVIALATQLVLRSPDAAPLGRARMGLAVAFFFVMLAPALIAGPYKAPREEEANRFLAAIPNGSSVVPLLTAPSLLWPMVLERDYRLPSRYYHHWMVHAVARAQDRGEALDPRLSDFLDLVRQQAVDDFLCNPPDFVIIDTRSVRGTDFDILGFFLDYPPFARLFAAYAESERPDRLVAYKRQAPLAAPVGLTCMPIGAGWASPEASRDEPGNGDEYGVVDPVSVHE